MAKAITIQAIEYGESRRVERVLCDAVEGEMRWLTPEFMEDALGLDAAALISAYEKALSEIAVDGVGPHNEFSTLSMVEYVIEPLPDRSDELRGSVRRSSDS